MMNVSDIFCLSHSFLRHFESWVDVSSILYYTVFRLDLGQILREYAVSELHLTLNAGYWNYDRWGYPEENGVGTGAELWAWMSEGTTT